MKVTNSNPDDGARDHITVFFKHKLIKCGVINQRPDRPIYGPVRLMALCEKKMTTEITSKIINSVGLFCDIAGAWLVAWEVVRQYKGKTHGTGFAATDKNNPKQYTQTVYEMPDYRKYQTNKYTKMKLGLAFLTIGFLLQFVSNWVYLVDKSK